MGPHSLPHSFPVQQERPARMFIALAYGFVLFTAGLVVMLLWLAWENHRHESGSRR